LAAADWDLCTLLLDVITIAHWHGIHRTDRSRLVVASVRTESFFWIEVIWLWDR
jgi:hypothetical protein